MNIKTSIRQRESSPCSKSPVDTSALKLRDRIGEEHIDLANRSFLKHELPFERVIAKCCGEIQTGVMDGDCAGKFIAMANHIYIDGFEVQRFATYRSGMYGARRA